MRSTASPGPRRRAVKGAAAVLTAAALVVALGACSSRAATSDTGSGHKKFTTVTIVTPATESDHGWNQQGLAGATAATKALGVKLTEDTNVGYDNTQTILTQAAKKPGVGLVIAHASGFGAAATHAAQATGVPMLVTDNPSAQIKGQIGVITFAAEQGGYLAGIAAAMTTKTKIVGIAVSADDINWFTMSGGFIAGIRSVDPSIQIKIAYIGAASYDDSAGGQKVASQLIAAGADVIFGMGDGATIGYVAAVEAAPTPVKYIADIGDVDSLVKNQDEVLTSARWNFAGTYEKVIKDVQNGTFARKPYNLNLANGGMSLQDTPNMTPAIRSAVSAATKKIEDGSIKVPDTTTRNQVAALLASGK